MSSCSVNAPVGHTATHVEGRRDGRVETAANGTEGAHGLDVVAYALAPAAEYALVHIPHDGRSEFLLPLGQFTAAERHLGDIQPGDKGLEFALAALRTGEAIVRVVREYQLGDCLASLDDPHRIGPYDHVGHTLGRACWSQVAAALDFDDAEPAGCGTVLHARPLEVHVAKRRDIDSD